jgi:kynureninase
MHTLASLAASPNSLAPHYRDFRVAERLLLTGHSHQAWPDCAREGLLACYRDAAEHVDEKWQLAFEHAQRVRAGFRRLLGNIDGDIALAASTHELVVRFLSALPVRERPRIVTSDAEFHSLRRQLERLSEEGIEVVRVPAAPVETLVERMQKALASAPTAAVLVSSVLFNSAEIVPNLPELAHACERENTPLLIDAYHQLGVVPWQAGLASCYVVGGGYKYLQLGEGNCFLRTPPDCALRPLITGWFAEFAELESPKQPGLTRYPRGDMRFAGSTYDPASHYRGSAVLEFFATHELDVDVLRENSQRQIKLLANAVAALGLPPALLTRATSTPLEGIAGFLALRSPLAQELAKGLLVRGVTCDVRGEILRLGPAPYLSDAQLRNAVLALAEAASSETQL